MGCNRSKQAGVLDDDSIPGTGNDQQRSKTRMKKVLNTAANSIPAIGEYYCCI